jgi:predicted ArsR family transcriptional regulator
MSLDSEHGRWTMLDGPAIDHLLTGTRKRIHTLLRIKGPMSPAQVAEELDISRENAKQTMRRMVEDVQLAHGVEDGMYEAR